MDRCGFPAKMAMKEIYRTREPFTDAQICGDSARVQCRRLRESLTGMATAEQSENADRNSYRIDLPKPEQMSPTASTAV